jgi:hypothetical protein
MLGSGLNSDVSVLSTRPVGFADMATGALGCPCRHLKDKATVLEVQKSADNGCQYCKVLWTSIHDFIVTHPEDRQGLNAEAYVHLESDNVRVHGEGLRVEYLQLFTTDGY